MHVDSAVGDGEAGTVAVGSAGVSVGVPSPGVFVMVAVRMERYMKSGE
jgi:hypothetical protein